jgi:predicted secreted hydrolase
MMRPLLVLLFVLLVDPALSFEVADGPWTWDFPRDHASHPAFGTEWWYFTGSLQDDEGHRHGFELTFFRVAMREEVVTSTSAWRARDLIIGHLAWTDVENAAFHHDEVVQRAAADLAGAREDHFEIWAGDWRAVLENGAFLLRAPGTDFGVDLRLTPARDPILHGANGLSRKKADGSAASYYYSQPRLATTGTITSEGQDLQVTGTTWMDHEFFSGATPAEGIGWDWFSARFDDGRDFMLYTVRHLDGELYRFGTLIEPDGSSRHLDLTGMTMQPLEHWTSPDTGSRYPTAWRITIPAEDATLQTKATLSHQEIVAAQSVGFAYWEGLTDYSGIFAGEPVSGDGYVELTGY